MSTETVPKGYKRTEVGVIPDDWRLQKIRDVCRLINGRGFKPYEWQTSGFPIIRIQNLNGSQDFNYFQGKYDKKIEVEPGQLLFAWSGSRGTSFGPHVWNGPIGVLNYHTWKITVDSSVICDDYFFFALKKLTLFIEDNAHGASALVHTQKWEMEGFDFPCPPTLAEQQAIAAALSDADALIESLEQLIAKKRQIKQGAMQELLTGKRRLPGFTETAKFWQSEFGAIPKDWRILSLVQLCVKIQDGTHFSPVLGGQDYRYITSKNIRFGFLDLDNVEWISKIEHDSIYKRCDVRFGDILLTKDGANTGNAAINTLQEEFSLLSSVALLRIDPEIGYAEFILQQLLSTLGQTAIKDAMSGNAITRLTLEKIRKLKFIIPTLPEQTAIASVLSDMDAEVKALEVKLDKARQVKQGMMQQLLTGKVRLV